jgi:outer membrane protein OmpA-like peptidoglycan-associated protein
MVLLLNKEHADQWRVHDRWHWIVAALLALLLIFLWLTGRGPNGGGSCGVSEPTAAVPAPSTALPYTPTAPATEPSVAAPPTASPVANLYFDTGSVQLPQDSTAALAAVVAYLQANPDSKAVISGYHDSTGNQAGNEELAKNRAKSVREALTAAGISDDRIALTRPRDTTGSGDAAEARRVEVGVQ